MNKKWYRSKTLWANIIAIVAFVLTTKYGIELDAETQALVVTGVLGTMNIILRIFTKQPVTR